MKNLPVNKNKLQQAVNNVHEFSKIQNFKINHDKTHTVVFNTATSKDFYPRITNPEGQLYNNEENFKILGLNLATDRRKGINYDGYINKCLQIAYSKLWILRRLAEIGTSIENMIISYNLRVRIFVEMNLPLWMFSLTKAMKIKIENLQKVSVYIILGKHAHTDYLCNLAILDMEPLEERRQKELEEKRQKELEAQRLRDLEAKRQKELEAKRMEKATIFIIEMPITLHLSFTSVLLIFFVLSFASRS